MQKDVKGLSTDEDRPDKCSCCLLCENFTFLCETGEILSNEQDGCINRTVWRVHWFTGYPGMAMTFSYTNTHTRTIF